MKKFAQQLMLSNRLKAFLLLSIFMVLFFGYFSYFSPKNVTSIYKFEYQGHIYSLMFEYPSKVFRTGSAQKIKIWVQNADLTNLDTKIDRFSLIFTSAINPSYFDLFVPNFPEAMLDTTPSASGNVNALEIGIYGQNIKEVSNINLSMIIRVPKTNGNLANPVLTLDVESTLEYYMREYGFIAMALIFVIAQIFLFPQEFLSMISDKSTQKIEQRVADAEAKAESSPEKVKPAWDLARVTLEAYFTRNLRQVNLIFGLSVGVMVAGFIIIIWGVTLVLNNPNSVITVIITSITGIITEFVGATFLVIYRSTIQQASNYLKTLERINSVGMAMQILDTMPDDTNSNNLKNTTKSEIVKLLLKYPERNNDQAKD